MTDTETPYTFQNALHDEQARLNELQKMTDEQWRHQAPQHQLTKGFDRQREIEIVRKSIKDLQSTLNQD